MKAYVLIAMLCALSLTATAQMKDRIAAVPGDQPRRVTSAAELTRQMAGRLHLNEAQYIRLRAVNQVKLARMDEIHWQYQHDPAEQQRQLTELQAQYEQECQRILTPSQISLLHDDLKRETLPIPAEPGGNGLG